MAVSKGNRRSRPPILSPTDRSVRSPSRTTPVLRPTRKEAGRYDARASPALPPSTRATNAHLTTGLCPAVTAPGRNREVCGGGLSVGHTGNVLAVDHILMSGGKRCDP
jgi:hypothetical protein